MAKESMVRANTGMATSTTCGHGSKTFQTYRSAALTHNTCGVLLIKAKGGVPNKRPWRCGRVEEGH